MKQQKKLYVQHIESTCSGCPNFEHMWNLRGENGKQVCTASERPDDVLKAWHIEDEKWQADFRIVPPDFQGRNYNPVYPIPDWCPLPDDVEK